MEDGLNELVANMKELDVEEMEEEQLNSELQRDLCFAVLCERMDERNYLWEWYVDESTENKVRRRRCLGWCYSRQKMHCSDIIYDPKLAAEFILSGKEQFRAFMKFCKSVKTLKIYADRPVFYFDKDVCMTQSTPVYKHVQKMFKSDECFFIKTLLKFIKRLVVLDQTLLVPFLVHDDPRIESLFPHLSKMQNLEELVIYCCHDVNVLVKLLKKKPMKTIEARLYVFQRLDKFVKNYKLEKMVIVSDFSDYKIKDVLELTNFSPAELHLTPYSLDAWEAVSENNAFTDTKKLTVESKHCSFRNYDDDTLVGEVKNVLSTVEAFIDSVQKRLPKLEELVFNIRLYVEIYLGLNHEGNQMKAFADLCADFVKKYQGKLDVKVVFVWQESYIQRVTFREYMEKQFPDHKFEVIEGGYRWKNYFSLAKNVFLDYDVRAL